MHIIKRPGAKRKSRKIDKSKRAKVGKHDIPTDVYNMNMANLQSLIEACKVPCRVLVRRLTKEEILQHTSTKVLKSKKKLDKRQEHAKAKVFEKYKHYRQKFFNKKKDHHTSNLNYSSDNCNNVSDDKGTVHEIRTKFQKDTKSCKRKLLYPVDDGKQNSDSGEEFENPIKKTKAERALRINTRRKRIESTSSVSSNEDSKKVYDPNVMHNEDVTKERLVEKSGNLPDSSSVKTSEAKRQQVEQAPSSLLDSDVLSKIMKEMQDFQKKNGKKVVTPNLNDVEVCPVTSMRDPKPKKRRSYLLKNKKLRPLEDPIESVLNDLVNKVCTIEEEISQFEGHKRKKCKWCDSPFTSSNDKNILCLICRSVVKVRAVAPSKKSNELQKRNPVSPKNMVKKMAWKNLPKFEQQRLLFNKKTLAEKGYSHCKSFVTPKDIHNSSNDSSDILTKLDKPDISRKRINITKKGVGVIKVHPSVKDIHLPKTQDTKHKKKKRRKIRRISFPVGPSETLGNMKTSKAFSLTTVDNGLFLMNFPSPQHGLEDVPALKSFINPNPILDIPVQQSVCIPIQNPIEESACTPMQNIIQQSDSTPVLKTIQQPACTSVLNPIQSFLINQQSASNATYLLPSVPTVVVANYTAPSTENGDYLLSNIYYQNEAATSQQVVVTNASFLGGSVTASANCLPSMPSIDQLSVQQTHTFQSSNAEGSMTAESSLPVNSNPECNNSQMNDQTVPTYGVYTADLPNCSNSVALGDSGIKIQSISYGVPQITLEAKDQHSFINSQQLLPSVEDCMEVETSDKPEEVKVMLPIETAYTPQEDVVGHEFDFLNRKTEVSDLFSDITAADTNTDNSNVFASTVEDNDLLNENGQDDENQDNEYENLNANADDVNKNLSSSSPSIKMCAELDAICILGVIDLEKNPISYLDHQIAVFETDYMKLKSVDNQSEELISQLGDHGYILRLAKKLLNRYGSFTKLSNSCLRHAKLLQIKKEKFLDPQLSSCQFAQDQPSQPSLDIIQQPKDAPAHIIIKKEKLTDNISVSEDPVEPQVNDGLACSWVTSNFQSISDQPGDFSSDTFAPRSSDSLTESRETPSRGSGPETPTRPESAVSQPDMTGTPQQVKQERLERSSSVPSQCAYSEDQSLHRLLVSPTSNSLVVSTTSNSIASIPNMAHAVPSPQAQHNPQPNIVNIGNNHRFQANLQRYRSIVPNISITRDNLQLQRALLGQNSALSPNVAVSPNRQPTISNLLSLSSRQRMAALQNAALYARLKSGNVTLENASYEQVSLQPDPPVGLRTAVQTVNSTRFHQTSESSLKTAVVMKTSNGQFAFHNTPENLQVLQNMTQRMIALQNMSQPAAVLQSTPQTQHAVQSSTQNVQVAKAPPPTYQQTVMDELSKLNRNVNFALDAGNQVRGTHSVVACALCNKPPLLRCKQCAQVAYCSTKCAKTYWHTKHKAECLNNLK